ncbi:MAG: hydroxymethylbilane synthase [Candidatus Dadabacteria bacterium]|nr:hydroxymethylbilane synthase [Candidatus Dadabacteria bacterium]NIQ16559.1 hydroxymethylbilane synthase [Candidatus Dadabacteria bacterium]
MMLRIGTRGSKLALWQANFVAQEIRNHLPDLSIDIKTIKTTGDINLSDSLSEIGGKGVFVKEIEEALLSKEIDIAVHSLKDVPSNLPDGLIIGSVLKRHNPKDCLVSKNGFEIDDLPEGAKVGTGSLRRKYQLQSISPKISVLPIRGNVDTRLKKLFSGEFDAIVLASAGLERLGLESNISQYFEIDEIIPAPCQGIIGIECRENDDNTLSIISEVNDNNTEITANLERSFLKTFGGDCTIPLGCYSSIRKSEISVDAIFIDVDNSFMFKEKMTGNINEYEIIGEKVAKTLIIRAN